MHQRFVAIWFRYLDTDSVIRRQPALSTVPFILATPCHGRMMVTAASSLAEAAGIHKGMAVADARAILPSLQVINEEPGRTTKLLHALAEWCIRYSPQSAPDPPDGLILDSTGCAHLWGGEKPYLHHIVQRLNGVGYHVRVAMADTIGTAWAIARFGQKEYLIASGEQANALLSLPSAALRLEQDTLERLQKLGLLRISNIIGMPRAALRRRFGQPFLLRLDQALGDEDEIIHPVQTVEPYQERLPCLEPIVTATGIEIALKHLLELLCQRLQKIQNGLRSASFKGYRVDGKIEQVNIGTNRASNNAAHLYQLFESRLSKIEPSLGIELFVLEAGQVTVISPLQEKLWEGSGGLADAGLSQLIDRLANKIGSNHVHRYLPDEHHWPERSIKVAASLDEQATLEWPAHRCRPIQLLPIPDPIEVTAPIPDYPPMMFRYQGRLHTIKKADGPERIEQEWWLQEGQHRDYYIVEDEEGKRYWLFRSGHYDADRTYQWFIHGFFA